MEVDDLPGGGEESICQPSAANIGSLPEEMLIHILSYLSHSELCNTVPKVCTLWEAVHGDSRLYREVTFRQGDDIDVIDTCMEYATSLKSFTLIAEDVCCMVDLLRRKSIFEGIGEQLRSFTVKLAQRDCFFNHHHYYFEETVIRLLKKCLKLEILHLELFFLTSDTFYKYFFNPNNTTFSLKELRIVRLMNSTGSVKDMVEFLGSKDLKLEELSVYNNSCSGRSTYQTSLTGQELNSLCKRRCDTLRLLHLNYIPWPTEALRSLKLCRCLQDLSFYNAYELSDEGLLEIASLNGLRNLKLSGCKEITEGGWILMITNPAMKGLESLVLDKICGVSNNTAVAIGDNLHHLKILSLSHYHSNMMRVLRISLISSTGFLSIIKGCPKLDELSIYQAQLIPVVDFYLLPIYLPRLQKLTINYGPNDHHIWIYRLRRIMPLLKIIFK